MRGVNVFALFGLMRFDLPDADIERIAADDVREAGARVAAGRSLEDLVPADRPLLDAPAKGDPGLCQAHFVAEAAERIPWA